MTLAKYIHNLLFRYECVIIPEFGGFLTKTVSAKIDEKTNTLYPPSKRLSFNSQLIENDGLLANYIASVDGIPYEKAMEFINFEVTSMQNLLKNGTEIKFEGIGVFSLNDEDKLVFTPDENANFLTDSFGLSPIVAPEVSREELQNEEVVFDSISDIISDKDIAINTDTHRDTNYSSIFSYAAIFAVLAVVGYFIVNTIIKNNKVLEVKTAEVEATKENMLNKRIQEATFEINKTLPPITLKVTKIPDSLKMKESEVEGQEIVNSDTVANENINNSKIDSNDTTLTSSTSEEASENAIKEIQKEKVSSIPNSNVSGNKYHIIAGAFKEPGNAEKKVRQLIEKGYDAHVVGINKWQLTQVAFASYSTKEEAQKALREIRNTVSKDAWLLVK